MDYEKIKTGYNAFRGGCEPGTMNHTNREKGLSCFRSVHDKIRVIRGLVRGSPNPL